ncbi:MAG TPA: hydantoinase B/oxoprolinase family protein [Actinomycetota bacterium]|nr:hydantoinase B/oxoprolinase family protein [Actinomycetota bacterium]
MDPLTLEVVQHSLAGIAEEMGATLRRTARSPNITEREDASCALTTPAGEMCAQAEHIPVHLGAMPASVAAALEEFPDLVEGDAVLLNDPFAGGTHLNDLTLVSPVFDPEADKAVLLGFVANRAHHADVGGKVPGSMPGDSTDIYQEGLRLPPVLAWRRGVPQDTFLKVIAANSRTPAERWGDLLAQAGANATGAARLRALARRIGAGALSEAMEALIEYSERAVRAGIAALPDGEWTFEDYLDSDGAGSPPVRIQATVRIDGDELEVDFSGTDAQARGNVNAPLAVTVSAVTFVVRAVTGPDIPPTAGGMRPVTVVAPPGTVVNALPPAAVSAGNVETSQRIVDVLFGALARAIPDRIPAASQGTMNNLIVGGPTFAYYETIGGGQGGRPGLAGMDGVHTGMTNTKNTPAEALEYAYPLRVSRYELREGTGGAGRWPGGLGIRRDVEVLCDSATVSLQTDRRGRGPWGLSGGGPGAPGRNLLLRDGTETELPDKVTLEARKHDIISVQSPGGGAWGNSVSTE